MLRGLTKISYNVKEKVQNLPLGPLTCICGEEGSFKSATGIAIRLALTGQYDPIGKNPSDLIKLAADPALGIRVFAESPDGTAEWRLEVGPSGAAKRSSAPTFTGKYAELTDDQRYCIIPSDSVRDLLKNAKGEKKYREAIIRRWGNTTELPEPFALLPEELIEWNNAVEACRQEGEAQVDNLLASLSEHFRLEAGRLGREIKPLEASLATRRLSASSASVGNEQLPQLKKKLEMLEKQKKAAEVSAALSIVEEDIRRLEEEAQKNWNSFIVEQTDLNNKLESARSEIVSADAALEEAIELRASSKVLLAAHKKRQAAGKTDCPCCSRSGVDMPKAILTFQSRVTERDASVDAARKTLAEKRSAVSALESKAATVARNNMASKAVAEAEQDNVRRQVTNLLKEKNTLGALLDGFDAADIEVQITALRTKIAGYANVADTKKTLEAEGLKIRTMQALQATYKKLEKQAEQMQKDLMVAIAKTASDEVSLAMLDARRAELDPASMEWTILDRTLSPRVLGTACGTEETSLALGYMAAYTRGSPLRICLMDDKDLVGLSKKGMRDLFMQLEAAQKRGDFSQIILIWNRPDEVPENWLRIVRGVPATRPEDVVL